jgi:spore germination protein GerM
VAARKPKRKNSQKSNSQASQAVVIFWLVFVIIIIAVFMINAETIKNNFNLFRTRLTSHQGTEGELLGEDLLDTYDEVEVREQPRQQTTTPERTITAPEVVTLEPSPDQTGTRSQAAEREREQTTQAQSQPAQTRERIVYFTQIDKDGQILQSRVTRRIPVSETPMQDALNILIAGPSSDELNRGILNLIPQNTRILSATVRSNTAYISFSEDFIFNTFGVEGYVAQLRQIVWTVTEFPNVNDVQILIEGRRLDYLGEGIWIGSPINRQSF